MIVIRQRPDSRRAPGENFTEDTVITRPGAWHWHGAAPATFMTHTAIQEADEDRCDAYWGNHVTDDEYHADPLDLDR